MPGVGPAAEPLLFRQKLPKPLTPRLGTWKRRDANTLKSGPTRQAQTGSARCEERPSLGTAGRRRAKINAYRGKTMEREPTRKVQDFKYREYEFCWFIVHVAGHRSFAALRMMTTRGEGWARTDGEDDGGIRMKSLWPWWRSPMILLDPSILSG